MGKRHKPQLNVCAGFDDMFLTLVVLSSTGIMFINSGSLLNGLSECLGWFRDILEVIVYG